MGLLERGGLLRPTKTWGAQQRTFQMRKKCPPVTDCDAKNMRNQKPTRKQQRAAAKLAAQQAEAARAAAAARKAAKAARNQPKQQQRSWPNAGKYTPKR